MLFVLPNVVPQAMNISGVILHKLTQNASVFMPCVSEDVINLINIKGTL